jgi:hypothetical protein
VLLFLVARKKDKNNIFLTPGGSVSCTRKIAYIDPNVLENNTTWFSLSLEALIEVLNVEW